MAERAIAPLVDKAEPPQSIESEQGREYRPSLFCVYEAARLTNETLKTGGDNRAAGHNETLGLKRHMAQNASMEEFEALLNESLEMDTPQEGSVVKGKVIAVEAGQAIIDVGYKMEGRVELKEFANPGEAPEIEVGDEVEVFLRSAENARGEAVISREMARREEAWDRLEKAYADDARVEGAIFGRVKGGFTVDLGGAVAFLPGSQVDVRPVRDAGPLMGLKQPFQILKMDRRRGNIVVSRRAILEESRAEQRAEVIGNLTEGRIGASSQLDRRHRPRCRCSPAAAVVAPFRVGTGFVPLLQIGVTGEDILLSDPHDPVLDRCRTGQVKPVPRLQDRPRAVGKLGLDQDLFRGKAPVRLGHPVAGLEHHAGF